MVGPIGWAERGKERAELAGTAARGWLKAVEAEERGCGGWFPCLASRNRYAGGSPAPPTPPTPYVIAPRRPKPLFLLEVRPTFAPPSHIRAPTFPSRLSPPSVSRSPNIRFVVPRDGARRTLQLRHGNCCTGVPPRTARGATRMRIAATWRGRFKADRPLLESE